MITNTKIVKAKKALDAGKTLDEIVADLKLEIPVRRLNNILIRRYGTENIGNPMRKDAIKIKATDVLDEALKELTKAEVKSTLEEYIANL